MPSLTNIGRFCLGRLFDCGVHTLEKSLLLLPGERKSIPCPLMALFSNFHLCRRHFFMMVYELLY